MESRLQIQDIQDEELDMELTAQELEELEALKGGNFVTNLGLIGLGIPKVFPYGIPYPDLFEKVNIFR